MSQSFIKTYLKNKYGIPCELGLISWLLFGRNLGIPCVFSVNPALCGGCAGGGGDDWAHLYRQCALHCQIRIQQ